MPPKATPVHESYNHGDLVLGRIKGYPWWPGKVSMTLSPFPARARPSGMDAAVLACGWHPALAPFTQEPLQEHGQDLIESVSQVIDPSEPNLRKAVTEGKPGKKTAFLVRYYDDGD